MKKTIKTAMTSAMFAAALGVSAGSMPADGASAAQNIADLPDEEALMTATMTEPVDVYGPPEYFSSLEEAQQTTAETDELQLEGEPVLYEETTTTTEEVMLAGDVPVETDYPQPVYGPPSAFYAMGDVNMDNSVDARDLTILKRAVLGQSFGDEDYGAYVTYMGDLGDMNRDGVLDKEDVKALRRQLTGKSKEEEDAEEAAQTTGPVQTTFAETETTATDIFTVPEPVYGPPEYFS